jgi:hypothetical protein
VYTGDILVQGDNFDAFEDQFNLAIYLFYQIQGAIFQGYTLA